MKNIGIIGSGTMGIGIAQVAASSGCKVYLYDANIAQTEKSLGALRSTLAKLVNKQKITQEESDGIIGRIVSCVSLSEFKNCDLVIEAIIENAEIKKKVFAEVESTVSENCIISSNTSSRSIRRDNAVFGNCRFNLGKNFLFNFCIFDNGFNHQIAILKFRK